MKSKAGTICMLLGAVLVLAALSLFLWNRWEDSAAGAASEKALPQIIAQIEAQNGEEESSLPDPYDPAMTEVEIDGYLYIGCLSIPSLGLELPVMSDWSYPQLKLSPCRYSGSTGTGDLVICAHNYARHFGNLKTLSEGAEVYFTDMEGRNRRYEVAAVEILPPTDLENMTAGEYDLTLFTCTYGGQSRVTVRCDLTG